MNTEFHLFGIETRKFSGILVGHQLNYQMSLKVKCLSKEPVDQIN